MGDKTDVWQGTLALMVLKTLESMGSLHGYGIARRIEQTSGDRLPLNYGTLYPALLKLEQEGAIGSEWGTSDNNRKAKYYKLTRAGRSSSRGSARVGADDRDPGAVSLPARRRDARPPSCGSAWAVCSARVARTTKSRPNWKPSADAHRGQHTRRDDSRGGAPASAHSPGRHGADQAELSASATRCPGSRTCCRTFASACACCANRRADGGRSHHARAGHRRQHGVVLHRQHRALAPHRIAAPRRTGRRRCFQAELSATGSISYPNFRDWQRDNRSFTALAIFRHSGYLLTGTGDNRTRPRAITYPPKFSLCSASARFWAGSLLPARMKSAAAPLSSSARGFWARKIRLRPPCPRPFSDPRRSQLHNCRRYSPDFRSSPRPFPRRKIFTSPSVSGRTRPSISAAQAWASTALRD